MLLIVPEEMDGLTLGEALVRACEGMPAWAVREALARRDVRLDGARAGEGERVRAGQELRAYFPKRALAPRERKIPVVYEDKQVLVAVKPQGLPSQDEDDPARGDTALTRARAHVTAGGGDAAALRLCHRLDVQTGGLLFMAKTDAACEAALRAFEERTIEKTYVCRVKGCPAKREAVLRAWLRKDAENARVSVTDYPAPGAREIATAYRVLEGGELSRLEVDLLTRRTHQIRAHLAHIGHPVLGDDKYGDRALNRQLGIRRQQLWAARLTLHAGGALAYLDGRTFTAECPF